MTSEPVPDEERDVALDAGDTSRDMLIEGGARMVESTGALDAPWPGDLG